MKNTHNINKVSIVIPIYNEESNIAPLYDEIAAVLSKINKQYEIIFVDDCSSDNSLEILTEIFDKEPNIQVISLLGNQGQTSALNAGFKKASGGVVVAMDGDGQHNPKYIPEFIRAIEEGYDMASSWKQKDAQRNLVYSFLSNMAHKIIGKVIGIKMKYFGATMKAYHRGLLHNLELSGDLHRFAGALVYYEGIKMKEVPIDIRPRRNGPSKYNVGKIFKVALDLILIKFLIKHAKTPFRIFGTIGIISGAIGFAGIAIIAFEKYVFGMPAFPNTAFVVLSAMGIIVGIEFILFGLMSELISRIYHTANNKEPYTTRMHLKK